MAKSLLLVKTRCTDPARADEFNHWYDEIHIPDILAGDHVVAAQRFRLTGRPSKGEPTVEYLAIYEFDTEDAAAGMAGVRDAATKAAQSGRMIDCIEVISTTTFAETGARVEKLATA